MPVREPVSKVHVEPAAPCEPTRGKTVIRALTNTAIGATAFLLSCIGLRAILPFPEIDGGVSQKFRFFAAHKDEFDTLFIGSSRVYFQISPAIFDRVTRESGMPTTLTIVGEPVDVRPAARPLRETGRPGDGLPR